MEVLKLEVKKYGRNEAINRQEVDAPAMCNWIDLDRSLPEDVDQDATSITRGNGKESINIIFENITYTVNLGFRKGKKEILHGINRRLPSKQLIALMGPSGTGKSTLFDVLSGFRVTGVDGTIFVNGHVRDLNSFRK
ncbi:ATP-binding cassette sub-family G member [Ooceraea biroi]|uniref:ATP-binding cassette sub-family G member n=1 Tax=Ooceraea biroi TaxID=2015173 RepID=A0A026WEF9_OOCBI|nr:ATP-binding cassette sub-family G member [Ooceraea biroi]